MQAILPQDRISKHVLRKPLGCLNRTGDQMSSYRIAVLPGDGIGPETMNEVRGLIDFMNSEGLAAFETEEGLHATCEANA